MFKNRKWRQFLALAVVLLTYAAYEWETRRDLPAGRSDSSSEIALPNTGETAILEAYRTQTSGVMVEAEARVARLLRDDLEGSRHQRWIVELASGHTVLISHNIDLAPRVPLEEGDRVLFRGQYEWNDRGGVVHWTHHDPRGRRDGGWIRHLDREYR